MNNELLVCYYLPVILGNFLSFYMRNKTRVTTFIHRYTTFEQR